MPAVGGHRTGSHDGELDEGEQRAYSGLFRGPNTSVSRLAVLGLAELLAIFRRDLEHPPWPLLVGAGEINVGVLQSIGRESQPPVAITVKEDSEPENPAHAIIPQKLGKGLSGRVVRQLKWHFVEKQS